jgi:pseudouridylate synthase / pseudouridine kinase
MRTKTVVGANLNMHSTSPGTISVSLGGVGRNIAEAAHRILTTHAQGLSSATLLMSPVGDDTFGRLLVDETRQMGMRVDGLIRTPHRTAVCNMTLDGVGNLVGGVADMDIMESWDGDMVYINL